MSRLNWYVVIGWPLAFAVSLFVSWWVISWIVSRIV